MIFFSFEQTFIFTCFVLRFPKVMDFFSLIFAFFFFFKIPFNNKQMELSDIK